jgi:uncharacterized protein
LLETPVQRHTGRAYVATAIKNKKVTLMRRTDFTPHLTVFLLSLLVTGQAGGVNFPEKPPKEHFYVDQVGLLEAEDANAINKIAATLLSEEKIPILVVTIPSLVSFQATDHTVDSYAAALFDEWGIGSPNRNYGILLLVSVGDRKARIEFGKAWGGQHNAEAKHIMDAMIVPAFKRGDFSTGIKEGVNALDKLARGLALPKTQTPWWVLPAMILGTLIVIMVIVSLFKSGRGGWGWALIIGIGICIWWVLRTSASSSFGGGSSGGGGASGSW